RRPRRARRLRGPRGPPRLIRPPDLPPLEPGHRDRGDALHAVEARPKAWKEARARVLDLGQEHARRLPDGDGALEQRLPQVVVGPGDPGLVLVEPERVEPLAEARQLL